MGWEYFFIHSRGLLLWDCSNCVLYYIRRGKFDSQFNLQWSQIGMWEGGCYIQNTKRTIIGIFNKITIVIFSVLHKYKLRY